MKIVKLRNGTEQDITTVSLDHEVLLGIHEDHPAIFRELIAHCRTGQPFQEHSRNVLNGWNVLNPQGHLIEEMKNVALSMVDGDGDAMLFVSPVQDQPMMADDLDLGDLFAAAYFHIANVMPDISVIATTYTDRADGPPALLPRRFHH
jgi:hypothetical protein